MESTFIVGGEGGFSVALCDDIGLFDRCGEIRFVALGQISEGEIADVVVGEVGDFLLDGKLLLQNFVETVLVFAFINGDLCGEDTLVVA